MERARKLLSKILPYILMLALSIIGTYLVFYEGFGWGSDFEFHFSSMLDKYNTIIEKGAISPISGSLAIGLGVGNGLFYSPFSHYFPVFMALILRAFGIGLLSTFKLCLVTSVFVSGVFMYRFAMHFTGENKFASLIAGGIYILYPYRYFCAYCRLAVAEAFSFLFIPLFFMGLYDITHMEKNKISLIPFSEVVLGGALLYLTHNITALYVFIVGMIYLMVNSLKLKTLLFSKKYILCASVSVILLIGITSFMLFSQFELMGTGLYNITDEVRMWTNPEKVASRGGEEFSFCGLLNLGFLRGKGISAGRVYLEIIFYILGCATFIVSEWLFKKFTPLKNWSLLISGSVLFLVPTVILPRLEIYLGLVAFLLTYLFIHFIWKEESEKAPLYKSVMLWFFAWVIIVAFILMEVGDIWLYMPSILRNIQFPWRLWSLVQLSVSVLIGILANRFGTKKLTLYCFSILVGFLVVTNQGLIEKRIAYNEQNRWRGEISEKMYETHSSIGFNSEYCPQVFFDKDYKSKYDNSLYYQIKRVLPYDFNYEKYYYYQPVILEGNGEISVNSAYAPKYEMTANLNEGTLIQMPLIYYPGYKIILENGENGEITKLRGENIDGLVAFYVEKGSYKITTEYEGTPLRKLGIAFTLVSLATVATGIIYELILKRRKDYANER